VDDSPLRGRVPCGVNKWWPHWGANVSCPADSVGCVNRTIGSPGNGYPWACNVSSKAVPGRYTVCATGAPFPQSTTKKNVLVIGDSVSNGYFQEGTYGHNVPQLIGDVAFAQHAPFSPGSGGAGPTSHGLDCLDTYLTLATGAPAAYDAITFNFGLHNLGNKTADVALYTSQLGAVADRLVRTKAKLLYLMTTPMEPRCCNGGPLLPSGEGAPPPACRLGASAVYACDGVVQRLNAAAAAVMAKRGIPTLDLHSVVTDVCAPAAPHVYTNCSICRMEPCSFHYKPAGYDIISARISAALRDLLQA